MTDNRIIIEKGINFEDLEGFLNDVNKGELIGIHNSAIDTSHELFQFGSYSHLTPGNRSVLSDGPYIHCRELLEIKMPAFLKVVIWEDMGITLPSNPIFNNRGAIPINIGSIGYTARRLLIGGETISAYLEKNRLNYISEAVKKLKQS